MHQLQLSFMQEAMQHLSQSAPLHHSYNKMSFVPLKLQQSLIDPQEKAFKGQIQLQWPFPESPGSNSAMQACKNGPSNGLTAHSGWAFNGTVNHW